MKEEKNSPIFLRPRFSIELPKSKTELLKNFSEAFSQTDCPFVGKIVDGHVVVDIPITENHFWSPQLHLEIEATDTKNSIAKGLFGPKPQVWTLFMFLHSSVAFTFIGVLIYAYTKWTLKEDVTISIAILIALPIFWFVMYFLGRIGKKTGHSQMEDLHDFMISILEK
ncbi:6TM ABC transporter family protein [Flavicella marina]|uniref:GTP-binding protein n=1 Tax=Flavicella marina TaxID=1475951 RepID=UPI001263FD44|nr:GTP-binding protein [Flavicella marina]